MLTSVSQLLARTMGKDGATSLTAACIVPRSSSWCRSRSSSAATRSAGGTKPIAAAGFILYLFAMPETKRG